METKNITITIYGFWDDFGIKSIPSNGKIYFVFAGVIIGQNNCRILRTVSIGTERPTPTLAGKSVDDLQPGELFFYAIGDSPTEDVARLVFALRKKFTPSLITAEEEKSNNDCVLNVHMEGKLPGIYAEFVDFTIPLPEGEV